jgi:orotate phosphoribosyltransferase
LEGGANVSESGGLRLVGSKDALTITDCYEKVVRFCEKDAYPHYDVVGAQFSGESSVIQRELLDAMNRAMSARSSRKAWEPFIGVELPELAAVSMDIDLVECSDGDYSRVREHLRGLYERLASAVSITDTAATKMLFLKRPRLVAISDRYIREALSVADPRSRDFPSRGAVFAERGVRVADAVRNVGRANYEILDHLQKKLRPSFTMSKARIIDSLVWSDKAIAAGNLNWVRWSGERGWVSAFASRKQGSSKMDELYRQLYDAGCIKFGEFKLKSGIMSPVYVDFRVLVTYPKLLKLVGEHLGRKLSELKFDRIAALPYAGMPIGVAASLETGKPMIYPRKEAKDYGTAKLIEGKFEPGETAVVLDDVITDGGAKLEAIKPLQEAGLIVKDVVIILDREQGGKKILADAGYTLHSVTTLTDALDALVRLGKILEEVRKDTLAFIEAHQFA